MYIYIYICIYIYIYICVCVCVCVCMCVTKRVCSNTIITGNIDENVSIMPILLTFVIFVKIFWRKL